MKMKTDCDDQMMISGVFVSLKREKNQYDNRVCREHVHLIVKNVNIIYY